MAVPHNQCSFVEKTILRLYERSPATRNALRFFSRLATRSPLWNITFDRAEDIFKKISFGLSASESGSFREFVEELRVDGPLRDTYMRAVHERGYTRQTTWEERIQASMGAAALLYGLARVMRPQCIVETGTATGATASFLLSALQKNGEGKLISIDIPPKEGELTMDMSVERSEIGYLIPEEYRRRHEYLEGDAKILLLDILLNNDVGIFIHDSLHTRTHMLFEYGIARALMKEGTIIASDDILWNNAFRSFVGANHLKAHVPTENANFGYVVNRFDAYETSIGTDPIRA